MTSLPYDTAVTYTGWDFIGIWGRIRKIIPVATRNLAWQTFPHIEITGNGISIPDKDTTPSLPNDTDFAMPSFRRARSDENLYNPQHWNG
jgi:hypothetical protein